MDPRVPAGDAHHPRGRLLAGGTAGPRAEGPPRGDHRPRGPEDDDQRAELRGQVLAGRLRGLLHPVLGEHARWTGEPQGRHPPADRLHLPGGQGVPARRRAAGGPAHDHRASPRLAPGRGPPAGGRSADGRRAGGLRALLLPQRQGAAAPRPRTVLLPAQDREPPRGPAVELHLRCGPGRPGHPAGHRARHRADRDHHRRVRDGGDPLPAAQPRRRPERGTLGLHLLDHQELPGPRRGLRAPGPRGRDHDRPDDAGVHRAAGPGLPPPRRLSDRRHGGLHPQPA